MKYNAALKAINTTRAFEKLQINTTQQGAYLGFQCPECKGKAVIKSYGENKNAWYCLDCKAMGNLCSFVMGFKGIPYDEAMDWLLKEAVAYSTSKLKELALDYQLKYDPFLKNQGISEDVCKKMGVGRPKGKTMLAETIAFTVHDEDGKRVAYYGIRIKDQRPVFHNSFNPETYLYNMNAIDTQSEVYFTTEMFACLNYIAQGKQAVCNFGLPYLSQNHIALLNKCLYLSFAIEPKGYPEIVQQAVNNCKSYFRFIR
jgi:hypothetical protein